MRKKKILLSGGILSIVALIAIGANAIWSNAGHELPDPKEELRKLYAQYNKPDSFMNLSGTIRAFDMENNNSIKEETSFEFVRTGDGTYSRLHYLQNFQTADVMVQLDTVNHFVSVSDRIDVSPVETRLFPFESMLSDTASFRLMVEVTTSKGQYILNIQNEMIPEIKTCRLFYDPRTYVIQSAEIEWWKDAIRDESTSNDRCWLTRIEYNNLAGSSVNIREKVNGILLTSDTSVQLRPQYNNYKLYSRLGN